MTTAGAGSFSDRAALVMIVACLAVIVCTIGLLAVNQKNDREAQIRGRGISLVRLLAGLPSDELISGETHHSMLQLVSFSQGTRDFAYAALVDDLGNPLAEVSSEGVIVPQVPIATEPSGWIGERVVTLAPDQTAIMEYYAPVFESGNFAGQIRLGFFKPGYRLMYEQIPVAATLALLIFMLTPLFYYLLRHEIRPLAAAGVELEKLLNDGISEHVVISPGAPLTVFMERFNQFVDYSQNRIGELENERGELVASAKLIAYKKSRIEMVLQTLPEAVLILDEHGKITYVNDRITTLLGASKEDVLVKPPQEWCTNPEVCEYIRRHETTEASRYVTDTVKFKILPPSQHGDKTFSLNSYPLFLLNDSSAIHGTLVVVRDSTEESLAQASRSEFVAHLGHELKTPLNTLLLYSETLLDGGADDEAERIEAVNTIHDEVERLTSLVNNLLSITRIEMGSLDLDKQRIRLADLLSDISANLGRTAQQKNVDIELDFPRELSAVLVDKDLLRVAINNLVSNAVKYNHEAGTVRIEAEETDEAIVIHVRDTGLGIAAEECEQIFDKFYRSESDDVRLRSGHGLGLSLARRIVELHDGEITVQSELGKGSTFTITLWKRFGLIKRAI